MRAPHNFSRRIASAAPWLLAVALAGCHSPQVEKLEHPGPRYRPGNIYVKNNVLDPSLRRVAVLPITVAVQSEALLAGVDAFEPLLRTELDKTTRFDVVVVSREDLDRWTGRPGWNADDALPADFFAKLRQATACDGVLFAELTRYQPYQPLVIGWKLSLVGVKGGIFWAADETFDAGDGQVANAARDYAAQFIRTEGPLADPDAILSSPSRFGQYSLHALLGTLPPRQAPEAQK